MPCPCQLHNSSILTYTYHEQDFANCYLVETFRHGELIQCQSCHTTWFRNPGYSNYIRRIDIPEQLEVIRDWHEQDYIIPQHFEAVLEQIGYHYHGNHDFVLPCKVTLTHGRELGNTLLHCSNTPPFFYDEWIPFHQVKQLEPSEDTLPFDIIEASISVHEMGAKPIVIESDSGEKFAIKDATYFFHAGQLTGKDMHLNTSGFPWIEAQAPANGAIASDYPVVYADLTAAMEQALHDLAEHG